MAKNDTKTIFNVLSAKARKKEITNTDRKEVRQAVADLAAEIQGGYRLGRQEFDTFNRVYDVYREDMNEAFRNLPDESRNALGSALTAVRDAVQQTAPAQPAPENAAAEPASAPEPTAEQDSSPASAAETAEAPTLDLSVLNKDPKEMTDADRQILQNIINSPYTTETAKASARILADGNPLPEQPAPEQPSPEPGAAAEPIPEPENSAEDRQAALDSITTEKKPWTYSAGAIPPAAIAAAMASNEPDKALSNIDDLIAAQAYYKDDKDKSVQLDPIVENRLKNLSLSDITPANAESYRLLCLQCGNEELRQQALNLIADAIIQYDKEHFGSFRPNTEELAANYDKAHAGLKDKDPFACKHDPDKDTIDLGSVEFTDAAGKPLSEKETQKQKAAISALAREMAAQRLAKQGSYTPEELEQAYKDAAAEIVWGSQPKYGKNGKPQVDKDALASTIANQYLEAETFKDRCKQKFKDNPLVKKVSNNVEKIDKKLEEDMETVLEAVVIGRACRNTANIKNRQPIGTMYVRAERPLDAMFQEVVADELNVKNVEFKEDLSDFTSYTFKPQLKTVGPKYGKLLNGIRAHLAEINGREAMKELDNSGSLSFDIDGQKVVLSKEDLLIDTAQMEGYVTEEDSTVTVVLDTNLSDALIEEGFVREIISKIQTMRKEAGFEVMDKIVVYSMGNQKIEGYMKEYREEILSDVMASDIRFDEVKGYTKEWSINGESVTLGVEKQ